MDHDVIAGVARALAHPARMRILELLAAQSECRGHDLFSELPLAQSTVSEHLRVLKEAGLVESRTVGTSAVYCLVAAPIAGFRDALGALIEDTVCCEPEGVC